MTVYRVLRADHIEARSAAEAEEILLEANGKAVERFFANEAEAMACYEANAAELSAPHELRHGLYWFDGVMLIEAECDEVGDDLSDAFYDGDISFGCYMIVRKE